MYVMRTGMVYLMGQLCLKREALVILVLLISLRILGMEIEGLLNHKIGRIMMVSSLMLLLKMLGLINLSSPILSGDGLKSRGKLNSKYLLV